MMCSVQKCAEISLYFTRVLGSMTIPPLLPEHVLDGISKLPKMTRFWLSFPIFSYLLKVMTEK